MKSIQEALKDQIKIRKEARKERMKKYEGRTYEDTPKRDFFPLASDIIQDPKYWSEYTLDDRMRVVKV